MSLSEQLVHWAWDLDATDVPRSARRAVCRHVLDGVGNAIAALRTDAAPFATQVARRLGGPPQATLIGSTQRVGSPAAALALGVAIHALDFDDTHAGALVHPTSVVVPASLAVGEEVEAGGEELLVAMVAGYEAVIRLGAAVRHGFHAHGFHATSVCGVFAAALVAARLRGLDAATAVDALGIAGSQAAGSLEFLSTGSDTKQLHPGWASMAGIVAADLAAAGATGPVTILEGDAGLYKSYTGQRPDPETVLSGLSKGYELERITVKPYPACQLSHASLDAVRTVGDRLEAASVEKIRVELPEESVPIVGEPMEHTVRPRTPYDAKFSLPWCLAAMLVDGRVDLKTFEPDNLTRPELTELARRVRIVPVASEQVAAAAPGRVHLTLWDGQEIEATVEHSRGGPQSPLDDDALDEKFFANCGGRTTESRRLAGIIRGLGETGSALELQAALSAVASTHARTDT